MTARSDICRYRSKYGWFLFGEYYCEMAVPGKKWVATEAVCRGCRGPEYEAAYDCLYYRIGSKKKYSDKNEVIVYQYCFLPPYNEEKSSLNEIKASDRCGPDCDKKGYKKRPFVPGIEKTARNRKIEDEASSQKRGVWKSVASISADPKSPESLRVNQDFAPSTPVIPELGPKPVGKEPPAQEPPLPAGGGGPKEKEKQIEGLLSKAKEQANYGEYEKAIEIFEKVLTLDSENAKAQEGIKKATTDRVMKPWFGSH